ncbi:MAG TPA: serine hydrolase, partial [Chloroflexota bacterium]|nr:serine hydrolase [Chloroflexota bacterium]
MKFVRVLRGSGLRVCCLALIIVTLAACGPRQPGVSTPPPTTIGPTSSPAGEPPLQIPAPPTVVSSPTVVATPGAASPATVTPTTLQGVLDQVYAKNSGVMGVYVQNLKTGETASIDANAKLRSASLYKLLVLTSAYERVQSGALKTDQVITLSQAAFDVDPYNEWTPGTQTTVSCAMQAMITVSSNSAAEMLIEEVGGTARVTKDMQALGLTQSQIGDDTAYTSPADIAKLLDGIYHRTLVSPQASDAMLKLLLAQQHNDRLPLPLPVGIKVAHKTGELTDLRNEAGIVY